MASPNIGELATTTLRKRSKKLADNILNHNALLAKLKAKGNVRSFDGGRDIVEELMYAENGTVGWFSGYDTLNITPQDVLDAATFNIKQLAANVTMSGLEQIQNSGEERIIDWLKARISVAEKSMENSIASAVFSDGTTSNQPGGLRYLVANDPTTGIVGGINRATYTFWRNKVKASVAATSTSIQADLNALHIQLIRGTDKPDLCIMDAAYYAAFEASLQTIQRFADADMAKLGFDNIAYKNCPVVYDENCPTGHGYFLNTNYLHLRPHKEVNMKVGDKKESLNQDAFVIPILWAGNLTTSNASLQGVFKTAA